MTGPRSAWRTFRGPLAMALVSFAGLVLGLVAQGMADVIGFVGVALPVVALGWFLWRPRASGKATRSDVARVRMSPATGDTVSR